MAKLKAALPQAPDWKRRGSSITRTFQSKDFKLARRFDRLF